MPSPPMMILALLWSPLLLSLLIPIALLPNGSNAAYEYDGIITNEIALEVTDIFNKMSDDLKKERGNFLVEAFYAKGAFDKFKALSRAKVPDHPHHEDVHQHQKDLHHQHEKEMEVLEKNILKIFSEVPNGKYEDNLKQKVENTIIAVEKAIAFFGPKKNPNDEHTSKKSKVEHEFGMFEEWEQMSKFHTWLKEVQEKIDKIGEKRKDPVQEIVKVVKAGEEEKKDEKAKKEELEMAQKILELLHEPGSPFIAPNEGGKVEEANENVEGSQHNIRKKLHHHHQHSADSEGPSEQPEVMKKEMTNDQASAHSDNHNHLLGKNGGSKDKQKSDGNDTR